MDLQIVLMLFIIGIRRSKFAGVMAHGDYSLHFSAEKLYTIVDGFDAHGPKQKQFTNATVQVLV